MHGRHSPRARHGPIATRPLGCTDRYRSFGAGVPRAGCDESPRRADHRKSPVGWTNRRPDDHAGDMSIEIDLSFWQWIGAIVFIMGVGVVSGRILGVRRGFLRATAAGVIGSLAGVVVAAIVLQSDKNTTDDDIVLVAFGFALLATMVVSVSLEAVLRPRRKGRRTSMRTRVRAFLTIGGRLFEVSRIARRHGLAGPRLASKSALSSPEGGLRIRGFLEDCGGMFIKFGQIASTRTDLLPAPLIVELCRPPVEREVRSNRTDPRPYRRRAGGTRRRGLQHLQRQATCGGVHRSDAHRGAAGRQEGGRQGAAPRHRGGGGAGLGGPAVGQPGGGPEIRGRSFPGSGRAGR